MAWITKNGARQWVEDSQGSNTGQSGGGSNEPSGGGQFNLNNITSMLGNGGPGIGATIGNMIAPGIGGIIGGAGESLLGGLFGAKPENINYKPTHGSTYTYDPYAYAPGEENLYKSSMGEVGRESQNAEKLATQRGSELLNERGMGGSSVYGNMLTNVENNANVQRANTNLASQENLFGGHEKRAETERERQHEWNMGPGYKGQEQTVQAGNAANANLNEAIASRAEPYQNPQPMSQSISNTLYGPSSTSNNVGQTDENQRKRQYASAY